MLSTERKFFVSRATQRRFVHGYKLPRDTLLIRFKFFKLTGRASHWLENTYDEHILARQYQVGLSKIHCKSTEFLIWITLKLFAFGVPDDERPAIVRKLDRLVEVAVPGVPVLVTIVEVTLHLYPIGMVPYLFRRVTSNCEAIIDRDTWESMETYGHRMLTAKSFIEGLDKLRVVSLGKETFDDQCAICLKHLEEGIVTRLPCAHLFHRDCIVLWLERSTLCPYCRYEMPTVEASDLPWQLNWPMLLMMMTSGGILTATFFFVCNLLRNKLFATY